VIIPDAGLNSDTYGSAEFRAHLIPELTARAVEHCLAGSPGAII
jgi:CO/xanthine dehydrogenase FAD-binding subunit